MSQHRKAALIGAGRESLHTIHKAREQGILVFALDGDSEAPGLLEADYGIVLDISEEELTRKRLEEIEPDMILTAPVGRCLLTTGAVNDALGLKGIGKLAAELCVDKALFHRKLEAEGLRPLTCILLEKGMDRKAVRLKLPAIMKPRYGSGSRQILYLENEQELKEALSLAETCLEDFVLEEVAEGTEYGVDGAVDENGFHLILLRRKLLTPLPGRQAVGYLSVVPEQEEALISAAQQYIEQITRVMGLRDCLLHADLIEQKTAERDGSFCIIELSARPSGHNLHNRFTPFVTGVDMAEEYIRMQLGESYSYTPGRVKKALIHYLDFDKKRIGAVPNPKDLSMPKGIRLVEWECNLSPGDELLDVREGRALMERGYFLLEGSSDGDLIKAADYIKNQFKAADMDEN